MSVHTASIRPRWAGARASVNSVVALSSLRSCRNPITSPCTISESTARTDALCHAGSRPGRCTAVGVAGDGRHPSSRRGAPPHDWSASTDNRGQSVGADAASRAPSARQTQCARCECRSGGTARVAGDTPPSPDARPTADRARSAPSDRARGWCDSHTHCRRSVEGLAAPPRSGADCLACRRRSSHRSPGIPASRESRHTLVAIPRVLPCCCHIKRERHRMVRCQVGSLFYVQAAEQTAHPTSGPRRRPGISSNSCIQIGEQP